MIVKKEKKEEKTRKDNTLLRTLNFKIVPEMCHDQGRELSINDNTKSTRELKPKSY